MPLSPLTPTRRDSPQSWQAFETYRDMGFTRSLRKAALHLGKSRTIMERWSRRHHWRERIAQWEQQRRTT